MTYVSAIDPFDAWLEDLPKGWSLKKVGREFANIGSGTTPPTDNQKWYGEGYPWVTTGELRENLITSTEKSVTADAAREFTTLRRYQPGTLLVAMYGATIGRLGMLGCEATTNQACCALSEPLNLEPKYVFYWLQAFREQLIRKASGGGQPNVNQDVIRELRISSPSRVSQQRIVRFLDDRTTRIDALIAEKERLAESLKDIEEVTAFDMVTRGLNSNAARTSFLEPWLGEVPLHWRLAKIRNCAVVGNGSTPKRDSEDYWAGGNTPWLNSGSVNSARIVDASDYVTPKAVKECHLPNVRAGSTVVALTGQGKTRGRAAFAEFDTTINQHLAYISAVGNRVSDEYLWVALTGFYSVFRYISDGEGSTKGALTCEELNRFRLPVPPPEEQAAIVKAYLERIEKIDELMEHNELHLTRLKEYRSSVISTAVTGQLDAKAFENH